MRCIYLRMKEWSCGNLQCERKEEPHTLKETVDGGEAYEATESVQQSMFVKNGLRRKLKCAILNQKITERRETV